MIKNLKNLPPNSCWIFRAVSGPVRRPFFGRQNYDKFIFRIIGFSQALKRFSNYFAGLFIHRENYIVWKKKNIDAHFATSF